MKGTDGKPGKDGTKGINGPDGATGKLGKLGPDGAGGDHIKNELKVHLNALKSYVDMKFDVLKNMMAKYKGKKGGKKELGEAGDHVAKQIADAHEDLRSTLDAFADASNR